MRISRDDRRLNVAIYQANKLIQSDADIARIETELQAFHDYLLFYQVDKAKVITPLANAAREEMMEITENAIDTTSNAILTGDMQWFIDQLPTDQRYAGDSRLVTKVEDYKAVLHALLKRTERNSGLCNIPRDELRSIYDYTVGKIPESPNKFTSLIKHHRIRLTKVRVADKVFNGVRVMWKDTAQWNEYLKLFAPMTPAKKTTSLVRVK